MFKRKNKRIGSKKYGKKSGYKSFKKKSGKRIKTYGQSRGGIRL